MTAPVTIGSDARARVPVPFRLYLAGQLQSVTCSWAQVVAVSVVTVRLDPSALGWVVAAQFLPSLVLGPWAGVLADRHDRRTLLVRAEASLGLVAVAYAAAYALGVLELPVLFCLATVWGIVNAVDTPARRAFVPSLMPDSASRSSALSGTVLLSGMALGSASGGWLMATVGAGFVFALNAVSFAVDLIVLRAVRNSVVPAEPVPRRRGQVREGLTYVAQTPHLRAVMLALGVIGTFAINFQVSVPLLMSRQFGGDSALVGMALAFGSLGSLCGAVWLSIRTPARDWTRPAAAALAVGFVCVGVAPASQLALVALALVGLAWSAYLAGTLAILQGADPRFLGRVMSLFAVLLIGSTPIGGPVAGVLANELSPRAPFFLGAAAALAGWWLLGSRRPALPERARTR